MPCRAGSAAAGFFLTMDQGYLDHLAWALRRWFGPRRAARPRRPAVHRRQGAPGAAAAGACSAPGGCWMCRDPTDKSGGTIMRIFLTGGSGYIGKAVIGTLVRQGHAVEALARNERAVETVTALGAAPLTGGLGDLGVLNAAAARADAVMHLAQAETGDEDLAAATAMQDGVGTGTYVHTGGAWVYGDTGGVADETALGARRPSSPGASRSRTPSWGGHSGARGRSCCGWGCCTAVRTV